MQPLSFRCPACRTPLRVRTDDLPGSAFDCPECAEPLRLVENADGKTAVRRATREAPVTPERTPTEPPRRSWTGLDATPRDPHASLEPRPRRKFAITPATIGWATAAVAAVVLLVIVDPLGFAGDEADPLPAASAAEDVANREDGDPEAEPPADAPVRERLTALGGRVQDYVDEYGRFPEGSADDDLAPDDRLGWLAALEAYGAPDVEPKWDRPWRDPRNAEFIRRRRPAFGNPTLPPPKSPEGYPGSHFVGMGGVGADAPTLPVGHSRAGVFGNGRSASPEDVTDGLSNTIAVAGVQERIGAWAAGGSATVRPFVEEPYVNGPDGFGTGQAGSMLVLMADGSVRSLAADTDPRALRRMAAMADGLDLELRTPGEPGDRPLEPPTPDPEPMPVAEVDQKPEPKPEDPPQPEPPAVAEVDPPADPADLPLPELELPKWTEETVAAKLAQPTSGVRTKRPIPFGTLVDELAEMAGVPIHVDVEAVSAEPDQLVSFSLESGTVGDVLNIVAEKVGLRPVVEDDGIHLRAKADADPEPEGSVRP